MQARLFCTRAKFQQKKSCELDVDLSVFCKIVPNSKMEDPKVCSGAAEIL